MPTVTMNYGDYVFAPVPFITLNKNKVRNAAGVVGDIYTLTLSGTLSTAPTLSGGLTNVVTLQDNLRAAFAVAGNKLELKCDSTTLLMCYPKVDELRFTPTNNNWVYTAEYTIELTFEDFHGETNSPYISGNEESWNVEFMEPSHYNINLGGTTDTNPYFLSVTHNVAANGIEHFVSGTGNSGTTSKAAWEYAKDWVLPKLGFSSGVLQDSGVLNLNISSYGLYNHLRVVSRDEHDGRYGVQESWVVAVSGSGAILGATEDFTVEVAQTNDSDFTSVSINGQIQGLETRSYGTNPGDFSISTTKFAAASGYWNTIKTRLYTRAQHLSSGDTSRTLNVIPLNSSVGYGPAQGIVTYTYGYDDRPSNCISGSKYESIEITDKNPDHIVASIPIIGRLGPVLQDLGATTERTRTIVVEVTVPPSTGCTAALLNATNPKTQVATLLCSFQQELTGAYDQVFIASDSENWSPKTGRYSRNITWLLGSCTDADIDNVCV